MKEIGEGATSIVYKARKMDELDDNIYVLKEYHPQGITLIRNERNDLEVFHAEDISAYQKGLREYEEKGKLQIRLRNEYPEATNITLFCRYVKAYQTGYIVEPV